MINFYLALTALIAWLIMLNINASPVAIIVSLLGLAPRFYPEGLLLLNYMIILATALAISHVFFKAIAINKYLSRENRFSIAIFVAVLLTLASPMLINYTLIKQCFSEDIFYALKLVENLARICLLLLVVLQISRLSFSQVAAQR